MGNFPALMIQPPASPLKQAGELEQIKGAIQQQQMGQIELQNARQAQAENQTIMAAFKKNGGNIPQTIADAAATGQVRPQTLMQLQTANVAAQTGLAKMNETQLANHKSIVEAGVNEFDSLRGITDEAQFQSALKASVGKLLQLPGVKPEDVLPSAQALATDHSKAGFDKVDTSMMGMKWLTENEIKQRENASAATPEQAQAQRQATLKETQAKGDLAAAEAAEKGSPLTRMEHDPSQMAGDKLASAMGYLQSKIDDPNTEPKDVVRATRLLATATATKTAELAIDSAKKKAETAVSQGDPRIAAQLLIGGDATLSQLKARGSTPDFIAQTLSEAKRIMPSWNAQKAEADFDVAKSSSNVAFFGSAKSLIDKAGTLDQLSAAGKDIPESQIPVFNTVADAIKASTGSGPIAKYASIALGVADDYAKVMGGGQGSDTAREQALKLISAKQSPEQRDASIEGIRGAVSSQTNSRIGNNPVLKKMYGDSMDTAPKGGGKLIDKATAQKFYDQAGGDPDKARQLAIQNGWKVQ